MEARSIHNTRRRLRPSEVHALRAASRFDQGPCCGEFNITHPFVMPRRPATRRLSASRVSRTRVLPADMKRLLNW